MSQQASPTATTTTMAAGGNGRAPQEALRPAPTCRTDRGQPPKQANMLFVGGYRDPFLLAGMVVVVAIGFPWWLTSVSGGSRPSEPSYDTIL